MLQEPRTQTTLQKMFHYQTVPQTMLQATKSSPENVAVKTALHNMFHYRQLSRSRTWCITVATVTIVATVVTIVATVVHHYTDYWSILLIWIIVKINVRRCCNCCNSYITLQQLQKIFKMLHYCEYCKFNSAQHYLQTESSSH